MHIGRLLAALVACFAPSFAAHAEPAFDILELPSPGRTSAAGFADLDGDGHTDIFAVSFAGVQPAEQRELRVYFQRPEGTLPRAPDWAGAVLDGAAAFDVADLADGPGEELLLLRRHRVTVLSFAGRSATHRDLVIPGDPTTACASPAASSGRSRACWSRASASASCSRRAERSSRGSTSATGPATSSRRGRER
jgi:hypothetical protein